jgi:polyhydroxyalkanoate synthesis regulator phasin
MFDLIRKTLLTGVGLGVMTKEKVEELAGELSRRAQLTQKEGKDLVKELLKESDRAAVALRAGVSDAVRATLEKMDVATKRDIDALGERLTRVEEQMSPGDDGAQVE